MKVLVSGGAGYIGSHTVYELIENNYEVVIADNLQNGHIEAVHPLAKFYKGDIRDQIFLDSLFQKENIDTVVHFAADALVAESMTNPLKYYDNNLYGTMVLLKSMVKNKVKNIVFASTAATYGEPESIPVPETHRTCPTNTYGETKLAMEKMIGWSSAAYNLNYIALRYFNAAGAHKSGKIGESHKPETHLIPLVLETANDKRPEISIFGDDYDTKDGTCVRDYIHVSDLAKAHILALEYLNNGGKGDIFNLGNGLGFSVKEVIEACRQVTNHSIPVRISPRRDGDPAVLVASSQKAKSILGWQPEYTDIKSIIETAWNWHKNHPNGYLNEQ